MGASMSVRGTLRTNQMGRCEVSLTQLGHSAVGSAKLNRMIDGGAATAGSKMRAKAETAAYTAVAYLVLIREPTKRRPRSLGGSLAPEPQ